MHTPDVDTEDDGLDSAMPVTASESIPMSGHRVNLDRLKPQQPTVHIHLSSHSKNAPPVKRKASALLTHDDGDNSGNHYSEKSTELMPRVDYDDASFVRGAEAAQSIERPRHDKTHAAEDGDEADGEALLAHMQAERWSEERIREQFPRLDQNISRYVMRDSGLQVRCRPSNRSAVHQEHPPLGHITAAGERVQTVRRQGGRAG